MKKQSAKNKTILVIEDEKVILDVLADELDNEGFNVFTARDGIMGLKHALKKRPDLILLDLALPEMDGITLLKKLREDDWGKNVPVVVLTNLTEGEKIAEALERDVCDFLIKSDWRIEDIVKRIKLKLKNSV